MAQAAYNTESAEKKSLGNGYVFGAPVKDLGWFASLLMGVATGMGAFFLATFLGIVGILFYNGAGHKADIGLPIGVVIMAAALGYLGVFWTKRILRKA